MAKSKSKDPLARIMRLGAVPILFAGLFSLVSNLLYLALPIYTNQVYGRVLLSQSGATLIVLTAGVLVVFLVSGLLDHFRAAVLANFGILFDRRLSSHVFAASFDAAVVHGSAVRAQALRDLDNVRQAITGPAVAVMFDVPWMPIFMTMLFFVDSTVGLVTAIGGVVLLVLAFVQDRVTRSALEDANESQLKSYAFTEAALRNSEVVKALGMLPAIGQQWTGHRQITIERSAVAAERGSLFQNAIKTLRMFIQIVIIALGAWLIINRKIPPGMLFANMILSARALAPIDRLVGSWNGLVGAGLAYKRLGRLLSNYEIPVPATELPQPIGRLRVEKVSFTVPGATRMLLSNINFELRPGESLGVLGPSGAGKSTLSRLLVGVWKPNAGHVRLDGAEVFSWDRSSFGRHVGYLPQDTELFGGTVRHNIARFRPDVSDADVIEAAQLAGAHELILRLPKGYDTELGEGGAVLSVGQRQRVGLARAMFGGPSLVVLDEPNANLDSDGEAALMKALEAMKARGVTLVIVSHKANVFRSADKLLVLREGQLETFGPREEVLARLMKQPSPPPSVAAPPSPAGAVAAATPGAAPGAAR